MRLPAILYRENVAVPSYRTRHTSLGLTRLMQAITAFFFLFIFSTFAKILVDPDPSSLGFRILFTSIFGVAVFALFGMVWRVFQLAEVVLVPAVVTDIGIIVPLPWLRGRFDARRGLIPFGDIAGFQVGPTTTDKSDRLFVHVQLLRKDGKLFDWGIRLEAEVAKLLGAIHRVAPEIPAVEAAE